MRTIRVKDSDTILNETERIWWNDNAETIERIWAQNIFIQNAIRRPYLLRMKKFFLEGAKHIPVKILEVGCGSGWVCRLIADEKFHVIGTDFSEGQLDIARRMAKKLNKDKYCEYELADAKTFKENIDGVVIHALLHHLSNKELMEFFEQFDQLKSGTKVFIYEPIFFNKQKGDPSILDRIINNIIFRIRNYAINKITVRGKRDIELKNSLEKIYKDAEENNWYISPKEVPFYEDEFEKLISPYLTIKKKYIVNKTDLDIAQAFAFYNIKKPNLFFRKIVFPIVTALDKISFRGKFTHFLYPNQHLFVCFEMIKK